MCWYLSQGRHWTLTFYISYETTGALISTKSEIYAELFNNKYKNKRY
jgi:hypothetical protein